MNKTDLGAGVVTVVGIGSMLAIAASPGFIPTAVITGIGTAGILGVRLLVNK